MMREVSEREFFDKVGPLDVHPRVDMNSLKTSVHVSMWEIQTTRQVVGLSESATNKPTKFYLAEQS